MRIRASHGRLVAAAVVFTQLLFPGKAMAGAAPDPTLAASAPCPPADPILDGPPGAGGGSGVVIPLRDDPDGTQTVTLLVEDPVDTRPHVYTPVVGNGVSEGGVFRHRWPGTRAIVTYGLYFPRRTPSGDWVRTRLPLFLVENGASDDPATAALAAAYAEAGPLINASLIGLNSVSPSQLILFGAGVIYGYAAAYPFGYEDRLPLYVWTVYRTAPGAQFWAGTVLMHNGWFRDTTTGGIRTKEGCRRTRIGAVVRTGTGTTYLGGVYLIHQVADVSSSAGTSVEETLQAGTSTGGVDSPATLTLHQSEQRQGPMIASYRRDYPTTYASYQKDQMTLGVSVGSSFVPVLGTRAEAWHAAPPNAQRRLISIGVYDAAGTYHPAVGARTHFEKMTADEWESFWVANGGPGSSAIGNWEADLGTFDPAGNYVPVLGAAYKTTFAGALDPYQMMVTVGPWVAGTYKPAIGVTYDGQNPFANWAFSNAENDFAHMGRWLISAGTFSPLGAYAPLVGASFTPGSSPSFSVVEEYRVGVFPASYSQSGTSQFVPLAEAAWSSSMTSARWAVTYALVEALVAGFIVLDVAYGRPGSATLVEYLPAYAPAAARLDVGTVGADGKFIPVAGATITPGARTRYGVGVWAPSGFVPVVEVCYRPGMVTTRNGSVGVATGASGTKMPLIWAGLQGGQPSAAALSDCPA